MTKLSSSVAFALVSVLFLPACSLTTKHGDSSSDSSRAAEAQSPAPGQVSDEVSLKSDRSALADVRKEIPEEIKRSNDELALIFEVMGTKGGDEEPSALRDRFDKALRGRRDKNDKTLRKLREDYSKTEKRERDDFLEKLKKQREKFVSKKVSPDDRKRFFDDQDTSRREFFADQADKRKDFESAMQDGRKTFEDYAREKQNQFSQELRAYTSNYYDRRKNIDLKKRAEDRQKEKEREQQAEQERAEAYRERTKPKADPDEEFKQIPKTRGTQLAPADDGK